MTEVPIDTELQAGATKEWLTPGVRGIGTASLLADVGHEIPTSLLPSLLTSTLGVANGVLPGPYSDDDARIYARACLIPAELLERERLDYPPHRRCLPSATRRAPSSTRRLPPGPWSGSRAVSSPRLPPGTLPQPVTPSDVVGLCSRVLGLQ